MVLTRSLLATGVAGAVLFVVAFIALGAIRSGYDPMRHFVSLLSLTPEGWPMTITFLLCGLSIVLGGAGLWRTMPRGRGARAIPFGTGLAGLGLVLAGIFPTDPVQGYPPGTPLEMPATASPQAAIHVAGAFLLFFGAAAAAIGGARRALVDGDRPWLWFSTSCAVLVLAANTVTSTPPGTISPVAAVAGLLQRISIVAALGWIAAACFRAAGRLPIVEGR